MDRNWPANLKFYSVSDIILGKLFPCYSDQFNIIVCFVIVYLVCYLYIRFINCWWVFIEYDIYFICMLNGLNNLPLPDAAHFKNPYDLLNLRVPKF